MPGVKPEPLDVPIGLIDEPLLAARLAMDPEKLEELARDIRLRGVLQRLLLVRVGDRFEIVAGHRRFLASKRAGLAGVPADVYPTKEAALEGVKYAENRFREDMSPSEEANYFHELLNGVAGGDVDQVCQIVGESFNYVSDRLLLFEGCQRVFDALTEKKIKLGVAMELNKVTDERVRVALLHDAIKYGATIAIVRGQVTDWKRAKDAGTPDLPPLASSAPTSAIPQMNYFTCICCGKSDNVHAMQPYNIHNHCKLAILDPMLDAYHGRG